MNRRRPFFNRARLTVAVAVLAAASVPILLLAQYRVNNQIYGGTGSVRYAGSIQIPSATYQTPSQVRMAIHASGATPSQLKTEYNRIGPLAPSGAIAYVPAAPNFYSKSGTNVSRGNYVNTQVSRPTPPLGTRNIGAPAPAPAPSYNAFSTNQSLGSIAYTPSAAASYQSSVTPWSSLMSNSSITGQAPSGAVRYAQ